MDNENSMTLGKLPSEWRNLDWQGIHQVSWLSMEELLTYNYDQIVEDRRGNNGRTLEPGLGAKSTLREFLGEWFFSDLYKIRDMGAKRIVFGFD